MEVSDKHASLLLKSVFSNKIGFVELLPSWPFWLLKLILWPLETPANRRHDARDKESQHNKNDQNDI